MTRDWLFWLVAAIAVGTVGAGLGQLCAPGLVLSIIGATPSGDAMYFFSIVGMFMAIFGAMVLHVLFGADHSPTALLWASVQKLGASAAVGLGVMNGSFGRLALAVAGFDLFSGIVMLIFRARAAREQTIRGVA